MPYFVEKGLGQFTQVENEENYVTAKLRVHVERCIKRKKEFKVNFCSYNPLSYNPLIISNFAVVEDR